MNLENSVFYFGCLILLSTFLGIIFAHIFTSDFIKGMDNNLIRSFRRNALLEDNLRSQTEYYKDLINSRTSYLMESCNALKESGDEQEMLCEFICRATMDDDYDFKMGMVNEWTI